MLEPLAAGAIVKLAFETGIKGVVGKLTEAAINKGKELWNAIKAKFAGNPMVENAIKNAEEQKSMEENVENLLTSSVDFAMKNDRQFAEQIQNIAQQINKEINSSSQDSNTINVNANDEANVLNNQAREIKGQNNDFSRGKTIKK